MPKIEEVPTCRVDETLAPDSPNSPDLIVSEVAADLRREVCDSANAVTLDSLPRAERDRLRNLEIEKSRQAVSRKYQGLNTVSTGFENSPDAGYRQRNELTHRIDFIVRKYQTQEERRIDDMNRRIELQFALRS